MFFDRKQLVTVVRPRKVCVLEEAIRKIRYIVIAGLSRFETLICFETQFENLL